MKFTGAEQAVRFAYNMSSREILAKLSYGHVGGSEEGLSPHELHAQGAMILSAVDRLPQPERAAIQSLLAPSGPVKTTALAYIGELLWAELREEFHRRSDFVEVLVFCLSRRYRDADGLRRLALRLHVSYRKARAYKETVARHHGLYYLRAVRLLEDMLFGPNGLKYD